MEDGKITETRFTGGGGTGFYDAYRIGLDDLFPIPGGAVTPVRDFSLVVKRGEIVGLAGPSGCGKTVFCASLLGMLEQPGYIASGVIRYTPDGTEAAKGEGRGSNRLT
jgi:ABC-type dipeptide/oligopeptide/nickel transport system ATPase component